jgi:predicted glycosyltransferase
MRILVDIGHPAMYHLFKNLIREMEKRGHQVLVTAREKDVATKLLKAYNIPFIPVGKKGTGSLNCYGNGSSGYRDYPHRKEIQS